MAIKQIGQEIDTDRHGSQIWTKQWVVLNHDAGLIRYRLGQDNLNIHDIH